MIKSQILLKQYFADTNFSLWNHMISLDAFIIIGDTSLDGLGSALGGACPEGAQKRCPVQNNKKKPLP